MDEAREKLIELLVVEGMTIKEAAQKIGSTPGAVYNWVYRDPEFKAAMEEADKINQDNVKRAFRALGMKAIKLCDRTLSGKGKQASVAAQKVAQAVLRTLGAELYEPVPESLQPGHKPATKIQIEVVKPKAPLGSESPVQGDAAAA